MAKLVVVLSTAVLTLCWATPPPGHVIKPDNDKDPPKYEFGYDVRDGKGSRQGHLETRDGVHALGMYYVNLPDGSGQSVRYFADDWGYHPLVSYSSSTSSGSSKTHFALGEKAVAELSKTKDSTKIAPVGLTASEVTSSALKLATVSSGIPNAGDILKIRPGALSSLSEDGRKPSSSYQEVSQQPQEEQVDISAVNNLVDSNINGNGDARYETATPVYTATQLTSVTGSPSLAQVDASNYDQNENTGSSSYQLVEIGRGSSGAGREISGSHQQEQTPLFLSQVSETTNTESGKTSTGYRRRGKQRINIYLTNKNAGLQFGDRIPQSGSYSSQSNVEQEQNEIYKEEEQEEHVKVTPAPTPQKYSPLRPIIVAEIVSKEEEEEERQNTQTARPISVSSYPTPSTIHISHSPKSSSTSYSSLADSSEQSNFFSNSVGSSEQSSSYSGSVDDSERSNSYSSSVEHSSFFSGSAGNHEESGSNASSDQSISYSGSEGNSAQSNSYSESVDSSEESNSYTGSVEQSEQSSSIHGTVGGYATEGISKPSETEEGGKLTQYQVTKKYSTSKPNSLSYSKETSFSSSGSEQSSADTNQQDNVPYAQPLVHTTPSPILVPYSQGSTYSSAASGSSQSIVTNNNGNSGHLVSVQHTSSPVYLIYSQTPNPLLHYSAPVGVLSGGYVSSTPTPILLSQSQESSSSYVSSGTEEHLNQQSVSAVSNGNSGQVIESEHSTPNSVYISHSPQASSFISNSQTADSVVTSNIGNSGHIENSATVHPVYSTTARPTTTGYIVSSTPTPILIHSNPLPVPASVQSSASSGDVSHYQQVVSSTPQPPQVKEEIDDIPQPKTVVEVQKAISLDFNALSANANQGTQQIQVASTPPVPISYNQQVVEAGQEDTSNTQHQLFTGNLIQYAYNQPVIQLQAGYNNQPILQTGHLVYGYTPQVYEAQKVTAEIGNGQQQAVNYIQIQGVKQDHQQQVTETEESAEKYQQLTTGQNDQTVQQQVITTYNQQSASGGHQILSQQELPQATNVQSGYNQQLIHTETLDYKPPPPPPPPTSVQQFHIIQPVDESHQVQLHLPVEYQLQQHINQHVGLQTPVIISQESGEYGGAVQSGFSQHIIQSSGVSQENSQSTVQTSDSNALNTQPTNKQNISYSKNPIEIVKQLQSEYKHQLAEEQEQEKAKLGVQIKEALKQIHSEVRPTPAVLPTPLPIENEYPQLHHYINIPSPNHELKITAPEKRPVAIEHTRFVEVEKPVAVHHTKIVEKPIPVPHAVPVEVTKLVAVDRPVPYPQPYAVPHPVPVPYAVPQPVGVPVPHIVPYPHVITVPYKDLTSFHLHDKPHKYGEEVTYHYQVQNFPKGTPLPVILKALQYHGGRYGVPVSVKHHQHHSWRNPELWKSSDLQYLSPPPPLKPSGRVKTGQRSKYHDHFRSLCIEYGFKPPLKPSLQIDEIPASAYGPPQKED